MSLSLSDPNNVLSYAMTGVLHSTEHHILVFPSEAQAMRGVVKYKYVQKRGGTVLSCPVPLIPCGLYATLYPVFWLLHTPSVH